jgi:hypothetical protein
MLPGAEVPVPGNIINLTPPIPVTVIPVRLDKLASASYNMEVMLTSTAKLLNTM